MPIEKSKKLGVAFLLALIIGGAIYQKRKWFSLKYNYHFKWDTKDKEIFDDLKELKRNRPYEGKLLKKFKEGTNLIYSNDAKNNLLGINILNELAKTANNDLDIDRMANLILGEFYIKCKGNIQKDIDKAIGYLEKALYIPNKFGRKFYKHQSPQDIEYLKQKLEKTKSQINSSLALCFYEKGDKKKTMMYAHQAFKLGLPSVWIHLAEDATLKKDLDFAKFCIDEGIKTKDSAVVTYFICVLGLGKMVGVEVGNNAKENIDYPKDIKRSLALVDEFEHLDDPKIFFLAGELYTKHENGWVVNTQKGAEYYEKAAKLGDTSALCELGRIYYEGRENVAKNIKKGIDYLVKAAEQGDQDACSFVGFHMLEGGQGFTRNISKATYYLHKACDMNDLQSLGYLGLAYLTGRNGLPKNEDVALKLLNKADKLGSVGASSALGTYWLGKKNYEKAVKYIEKTATAGDEESQFRLAELYRLGLGVKQNPEKAIELYTLAAVQGNKDAILRLSQLR